MHEDVPSEALREPAENSFVAATRDLRSGGGTTAAKRADDTALREARLLWKKLEYRDRASGALLTVQAVHRTRAQASCPGGRRNAAGTAAAAAGGGGGGGGGGGEGGGVAGGQRSGEENMRVMFARLRGLVETLWAELDVAQGEQSAFAAAHYYPETMENYNKMFAEIKGLCRKRDARSQLMTAVQTREVVLAHLASLASHGQLAAPTLRGGPLLENALNEAAEQIEYLRTATCDVAALLHQYRSASAATAAAAATPAEAEVTPHLPRPFLSHGDNYAAKMRHDAADALRGTALARLLERSGVAVSEANPLLLPVEHARTNAAAAAAAAAAALAADGFASAAAATGQLRALAGGDGGGGGGGACSVDAELAPGRFRAFGRVLLAATARAIGEAKGAVDARRRREAAAFEGPPPPQPAAAAARRRRLLSPVVARETGGGGGGAAAADAGTVLGRRRRVGTAAILRSPSPDGTQCPPVYTFVGGDGGGGRSQPQRQQQQQQQPQAKPAAAAAGGDGRARNKYVYPASLYEAPRPTAGQDAARRLAAALAPATPALLRRFLMCQSLVLSEAHVLRRAALHLWLLRRCLAARRIRACLEGQRAERRRGQTSAAAAAAASAPSIRAREAMRKAELPVFAAAFAGCVGGSGGVRRARPPSGGGGSGTSGGEGEDAASLGSPSSSSTGTTTPLVALSSASGDSLCRG